MEREGLKSEAWAKATRSAGLEDLLTARLDKAGAGGSIDCVGLVFGSCISQRPLVLMERWPWSIASLSKWMVTVLAVNSAVHPWSQSWPMLSSDVPLRAGKMWALLAAEGSLGRRRDAVCVDLIMEWSGKETEMG